MAEEEIEVEGADLEQEFICEEGAPGWIVTFGDMMSLLLTFFILLLSFATLDILRFVELAGTIKQGFGLDVKQRLVVVPMAEDFVRLTPRIDFNSRKVMEELRRKLDPTAPTKRTAKVTIELFQSYRGVVVLFPADEIFDAGTDRIKATARPLLELIAEQAEQAIKFNLAVEVRRPDDSPRAAKFKDTWQLTAAQAVAVARFIRGQGVEPGRVIPVGRGPAPPTQKPGSTESITGSTVEFIFLSKMLKPTE
jgi:chemotaxis protein MotB